MSGPLSELRDAVVAASGAVAGSDGATAAVPTLERSKQAGFGDYATNAAMLLAPKAGAAPREVAGRLAEELAQRLGPALERVEVAGPGFLNLFLSDVWYVGALAHVLSAGDAFGGGGAEPAERIDVEFVSANPTGPMTAAGGRHAAYGDSLARLLEFSGHDVTREYYINDIGGQVRRLGESIQARARGEDVPEGGYEGDYVRELAEQVPNASGDDVAVVAERGVELVLGWIRASMRRIGVEFDVWFSEGSLHAGEPSAVQRAFEQLAARGESYRSEGALWLRTSTHGQPKDEVLERSTGEPSYFASDIAYHLDKLARGFDRLIDVWGADHHGHVARMHAALEALGASTDAVELIIMQFVNLVERGERASMSKRRGDFVRLDDLIDHIGADAARFFMLQRSHDTTVDLDLDLAREQTSENPVYYVQYAHARIASILRKAGGGPRVQEALEEAAGFRGALQPAERALVKKLLAFPDEVAEATERRAPHRIAAYALELAQTFSAFYRDCQVVGAEGAGTESLRLALSVATKRTTARALHLLGVGAPEQMTREPQAS
ncbi:MAG TPA: arginine--tRNA ligase [Solirubrobacteraceae bacterium]|nr:arginine--tRNA ligase [Solirubrobacteraceae bacterium]